jgi:hypothetical protein
LGTSEGTGFVVELREHVIRQAQEDFVAYSRKKEEQA